MDEETAKKLGVREVRDSLGSCVKILGYLDYPELERQVKRAYEEAEFRGMVEAE